MDKTAKQIAEEYREIPEYDRATATDSFCWVIAGALSDELSKLPYSELPDAEFNHLLVGIADALVALIGPRIT